MSNMGRMADVQETLSDSTTVGAPRRFEGQRNGGDFGDGIIGGERLLWCQ